MAARIHANPLSTIPDWRGDCLHDDIRRQRGVPSARLIALTLAIGPMSANRSISGEIRKAVLEADVVHCIAVLPSQLGGKRRQRVLGN